MRCITVVLRTWCRSLIRRYVCVFSTRPCSDANIIRSSLLFRLNSISIEISVTYCAVLHWEPNKSCAYFHYYLCVYYGVCYHNKTFKNINNPLYKTNSVAAPYCYRQSTTILQISNCPPVAVVSRRPVIIIIIIIIIASTDCIALLCPTLFYWYVSTSPVCLKQVISRIFYSVNRSWTGRIPAIEFRKSNFLQVVIVISGIAEQMFMLFSYSI